MIKFYKWSFFLTLFMFLGMNVLLAQNITFDNVPPLAGGGNTAGGQAFNFTTNKPITIQNLRGSFSTVAGTVTVWYRPVKINGQPTVNAANGWINLGSSAMTGITSVTTSPQPQTVPVNLNLDMNPGDTFGFMLQWTGNVYPTANTNTPTFTNGTVTIIADASCAYTGNAAMTTWFTPRQINGGVVYKMRLSSYNNAAITELVAPKAFCGNSVQDIKVRIRNAGSNVINQLTVKWSLNGTPQSPFYWTTPLDTFNGTLYPNDTVVTIGSVFFASASQSFKAWTEYPNSVADTVNIDDTITSILRPALSGTYTIGGTTPDYATLSDAVTALNAAGVCAPVVFNVAPGSGPYTSNLSFGVISGASASNTITFRGNGTTITSANTPVIGFSGSSYITIDSFNVVQTGATGYGI
ncbi:MAG: hypothetical protein V4658_12625, partial [Bacteroidota bacterium]